MIRAKKKLAVSAPIDPVKLKGYVERIENVEARIAEERDARADIYTEVKACGLKPKMVKRLVKERAKKEEDAAELAELERYRAALAMPGATYRSVAEKVGMPKSTLHRLVPRAKNGTAHDPETGEVSTTGDAQGENDDGSSVKDIRRSRSGVDLAEGRNGGADNGDGVPVGAAGREPSAPAEHAGPDRAPAGRLCAAPDATAGRIGGDATGADAGHIGVPPQHGGDDGARPEPNGRALHAPSGTALDGLTEANIGVDAGRRSEPSIPAEQSVNSAPPLGASEVILGEGKQSGTDSNDWDEIAGVQRNLNDAIRARRSAA